MVDDKKEMNYCYKKCENVDFLIDEINFEELYNKAVKCGCLSHGGGKVRDTNNRLASLEGQ
mgnify:FL=1